MTTNNATKINQLLQLTPSGVVLQSAWLTEKGYSLDLQKYYRESGWLQSVGHGAMVRASENPGYAGAVYALQNQSKLFIHPGGRTALSLVGKSHYLELNASQIWLFGGENETLPSWFRHYDWGSTIQYKSSSFLPDNLGLLDFTFPSFMIQISSSARAIMECLYLAPEKFDLMECYEIMENLNDLRPLLVQELLENCTSIKVKRLFLYMAEKQNQPWLKFLNLDKVDLGRGKRSLVSGGIYIPKYKITVPSSFVRNEQ
jgi:hypothetical protein